MKARLAHPVAIAGLALAACAPAYWVEWESRVGRDHPLVGRIWDVGGDEFLDPRRLVARLATHRFVLLGERHDHPDHHRLQARLVRGLAAAGRRPAVAFEMLDLDQAPALTRHLAAAPTDAAGLGPAVGWERSGWPAWPHYQPIAVAALRARLPLLAASLPRAATRTVSDGGLAALEPALAARLALERAVPDEARRAIGEEIRAGHCGQAPEARLPRMVDVQWVRDAQLAASLVAAGGDGAVLITGAGHARRPWGVPTHLARQAPGATVASLAFVEVRADAPTPDAYGLRVHGRPAFDFVWFTPRVDAADPCQRFQRDLERLRR
jgi:uncharacterized iron-regulated protein